MIKAKTNLKKVFRTKQDDDTRLGKLRLDMNESVEGLPKAFIKEAMLKVTPEYLATYPEYAELENIIANHNGLKRENICISNGSDAAIKFIFDAYVEENDRVLITNPTFAMYPVYCKIFKARTKIVKYGLNLEFPYDDFIRNIAPGIKMAIIVNPNNPTGSILEQEKILKIISKAKACNALVLVDEAYFYYYPKTVIKSILSFDNLIVIRTFSKLCGMASLRLGYAASCPKIIENLRKVKPTFDVNGIAVLMGKMLLSKPGVIAKLVKETNDAKEYLKEELSKLHIEFKLGFGNFILINAKRNAKTLVSNLKKRNVLVQANFRQINLRNYIRASIGDKETMKKFVNILVKALNNQRL